MIQKTILYTSTEEFDLKYNKIKLDEYEVDTLQRLIVKEGYFPHTEQFGHLEYMSQYTIGGSEYLFHKKSLMDVEVYRLEESYDN